MFATLKKTDGTIVYKENYYNKDYFVGNAILINDVPVGTELRVKLKIVSDLYPDVGI